jgi:hypothetical protein
MELLGLLIQQDLQQQEINRGNAGTQTSALALVEYQEILFSKATEEWTGQQLQTKTITVS